MARVRTVFKLLAPAVFVGSLYPLVAMSSSLQMGDIKPFPNARLDLSTREKVTNYPVVSSSLKKVNGVVLADSQEWLDGTLSRRLYLLPDAKSYDEAFRFFTDQFMQSGVEPVFTCERFSCGDSNFWANQVFDISRLYGLDKEQAYYLGKKVVSGQEIYYLTYTVKRGNRREYALVDVFVRDDKVSHSPENTSVQRFSLDTLPLSFKKLAELNLDSVLKPSRKGEKSEGKWLITIEAAQAQSLDQVDSDIKRLRKSLVVLSEYLEKQGLKKENFRIQWLISETDSLSLKFSALK